MTTTTQRWPSVTPADLPPYVPPSALRCIDFNETPERMAVDKLSTFAEQCMRLAREDLTGCQRAWLFREFWHAAGRPYLWERNKQRWPNGLFHLVDRDYQPLIPMSLSMGALRYAGFVAWDASKFCAVAHGDNYVPIIDDEFRGDTSEALRCLAGVMQRLSEVLGVNAP